MPRKVERTRNGGKWTEAQFWGRLRGALRKAFVHWEPANAAIRRAKVPGCSVINPATGKQNQAYRCDHCGDLFRYAEMCRDHTVPVGTLRSLDDVVGFIERLTPEDPAAFQALCNECHREKTNRERGKR